MERPAVITPVSSITYRDRKAVYCTDGEPGEKVTALYEKLTKIQVGDEPDKYGWVRVVPEKIVVSNRQTRRAGTWPALFF